MASTTPYKVTATCAALALWLAASAASATIATTTPTRGTENHTTNPTTISYEDCSTSNTFAFIITGVDSTLNLSVWGTGIGADCTNGTTRADSANCTEVLDVGEISDTTTVTLNSADIAAVRSDITGCADSSSSDSAKTVKLYFLVNIDDGDVTNSTSYDVSVDLLGPAPPTSLSVGVKDDTSLTVGFSTSTSSDIAGYYIYCDDSPTSGDTDGSGSGDNSAVYGFLVPEGPWPNETPTDDADAALLGPSGGGAQDIACGDFDGDGQDDLLFNEQRWGSSSICEAYLILSPGLASGYVIHMAAAVYTVDCETPYGPRVASAGDVDGDGFEDLLLGDQNAFIGYGQAFLIYGEGGLSGIHPVTKAADFRVDGTETQYAGRSVAGAGALFGDGYDAFFVGGYTDASLFRGGP